MARDMRRRGNADSLEPVTVWWAGKWLLVDGHHRMAAALKALGKDAMVPVTVLHGDIAAALTAASRLNYRVKLSMTRTERLDAAWRYATLVPEASKQLVMESTGVSEGTVSEQRRVAKALLQQWTDADFDAAAIRHPGQLSWREAQAVLHGRQSPEWDAEEALQVASEAILRMLAPVAKRIHTNPEAFARALRGLAPEFPLGILQEAFDVEWITGPMKATEAEALYVAKVKQAAKEEIDRHTQQATTHIEQQQAAWETRRGDPEDCPWMG